MQFRLKSKEIFYSKEWDNMLNSLIVFFPINQEFNLYDLSQKANLKYDDLMTDGTSRNKQTYIEITNLLIYNDFAERKDSGNIILTDRGRRLIEFGSYSKFSKAMNLKTEAEIKSNWVKKHWVLSDLLKILIGGIIGIASTLILQHLK